MENEERHIETCYNCQGEIDMDEDEYWTTGDGDYICDDCRANEYFCCDRCEELYHNDNAVWTNDGRAICEGCYSDYYFTCNDCNEVCSNDNEYYVNGEGYSVCDCCIDNYYRCEDCGEYYSYDDIVDSDDGYYCRDCYEEREENMENENVIMAYHDRDIPIEYLYTQEDLVKDLVYASKNVEHIGENMLKMGMEIEVENYENKISNNDMAKMIREKFPHLKLVFEYDSSIHGFEIITQPMTMTYIREHEEDFREICKLLSENGFVSHNGGRCGQHIHFSRVFFADNDEKYVGNLLNFFETYKREIYKFSRRENTSWCAWVSDNTSYDNKVYKSSKILCDYAKSNTGHGVAVNLEHSNTIEIRVFRGTLKFETMMANFEFVNSLVHIIREKPIRQINLDKVINYKGNKYLPQYCLDKGIYNSAFMSDETTNIFKELQNKKDKYEEIKKDVKANIENVIVDMVKLTKDIIKNSVDYSKDTEEEIKRLYETSTSLQRVVANNIDLINSSTLRENNDSIEENYREYIRYGVNTDYGTILRYYKNIKENIPNNDYTADLINKMNEVIDTLQQKYINGTGVEI